jgi:hypothetical protein
MGTTNSPDIFQSKINQSMDELDYVQAYLVNILILTKDTYEDHLSKLDTVLQELHASNLKVDIPESFKKSNDNSLNIDYPLRTAVIAKYIRSISPKEWMVIISYF